MGYIDTPLAKDIRKNIKNVRLEEIQCVIMESVFMKRDASYGSNKQSGVEVKLAFQTAGLNIEELTLLRDSAPNMQYTNGRLTCSWKLSKRFVEENENDLHGMMMKRLNREVQQIYEIRLGSLNEGRVGMTNAEQKIAPSTPAPAAVEKPADPVASQSLWSKIASTMRFEKHRSDAGMGFG